MLKCKRCKLYMMVLLLMLVNKCLSSRNVGDDDFIRRKAKANLKADRGIDSLRANTVNNANPPRGAISGGTNEGLVNSGSEAVNSSKQLHNKINHIFNELARHKSEMESIKSKYEDELFNKEASWKAMLEGIHTPEQQNSTAEKAKLDKCKFDIQANNNLQSSQKNLMALELSAAQAKAKREQDMILSKIAELQTATDHIYNYDQIINISPKDQKKQNEKKIQTLKTKLISLEKDLKSLHNEKDDRIYIIDMNHYKSKIWSYGCISSFVIILFVVVYFSLNNLNNLGIFISQVPSFMVKPLAYFPYFFSAWMVVLIVFSLIWSSDPLDSMSSFYNLKNFKNVLGHERYIQNQPGEGGDGELLSNLWWSDVNTSVQSEFCLFFTSYFALMILSSIFIFSKIQTVCDYQLSCSIRGIQLLIMLGIVIATSFWTSKSLLIESTKDMDTEIMNLVDKTTLEDASGSPLTILDDATGSTNSQDDLLMSTESTGVKPALNYLSISLAFLLLGYLEHLIVSQVPTVIKNPQKLPNKQKKSFGEESDFAGFDA